MIKFEHSVFALPFALTGAMLAWRSHGFLSEDLPRKIVWILVAMLGARSAAMTFNRLLDADLDALNPRTSMRHLPAGQLSRSFAWSFLAASSLVFLWAAWQLNPLCFRLAPVALAIVFFYSYTKRFTLFSHLVLGLALGITPAAAWIAMTGSLDPRILWLTAAVMFWTAGFDIIYSCQDYAFDIATGLHSIPAKLGLRRALLAARLLHVAMLVCLAMLVRQFFLGPLAWAGVASIAILLLWEHSLVKADDFSRVNAAFFTANGWVSILFFLFWAADILFEPKVI